MRMCHFRAQNGSLVMNKIFLVETIIITFIYLLALFTVQNSKKFLPQIQSYEDAHFLTQNVPFAPNTFFWKIIITLIYLLATFIVKLKKNSSSRSRVLRMCNFWTQNGPFPQMRFFQKTC